MIIGLNASIFTPACGNVERLEGILDYQSLVEVWFMRKSDVFSIKAKGILAFLKHRSSQEDSTKEL